MEIDVGNPDWKLRWDNTVKYSVMSRLDSASSELSSGSGTLNQNDGDNNFDRGIVSNRVDLFTELDLTGPSYGARISGAAWYDSVYMRGNNNTSATSNHTPSNEFPSETRRLMGNDAELLDAFVYSNFDVGDKPTSVRLGRHTLLWGESLFFGVNGIAGGQAPLDLIKLLSVPNSTFKEIARPTGKLSGQMQLSSDVSVGMYVGYEWEKSRLIPVGAYLSSLDTMGLGAERISAGSSAFTKRDDLNPSSDGQGGIQLRWRAASIDTDFGFYATRYHATTPSNIYTTLSPAPTSYRWVYHEGIRAYGASFSKSVAEWGWAGEVSVRDNAPLASSGQTINTTSGSNVGLNNTDNPGYAVGRTGHAQVSWIASLGPSFISREASFIGELAWNKRLSVTQNESMLNPNSDESAWAVRMVYAPTYRQVKPGLDLTPSIGVGYTRGRSSAVGPAFGVDKGGDLTLGLAGTYLGKWNFSANYVQFLGASGTTLDANNDVQYLQALKDRNYLTFSVNTTF
nr:DUF1302 family protein [Curvibacter sp. CHRR-16]